jgi:hypothetical protein
MHVPRRVQLDMYDVCTCTCTTVTTNYQLPTTRVLATSRLYLYFFVSSPSLSPPTKSIPRRSTVTHSLPLITMTVSTNNDKGVYQVNLETTDILYDYSDTRVLARYPTLEAANEAARGWLNAALTAESLPLPLADDEIEETFGPSGEMTLSYSGYAPPPLHLPLHAHM